MKSLRNGIKDITRVNITNKIDEWIKWIIYVGKIAVILDSSF